MSCVIPVLFQHHVRRRPHVRCHSRRRISVIDSPRSSIGSHRRKAPNGTHLFLIQHFVSFFTIFVTNKNFLVKRQIFKKKDTLRFSFVWNLFVYFLFCSLHQAVHWWVQQSQSVTHIVCDWTSAGILFVSSYDNALIVVILFPVPGRSLVSTTVTMRRVHTGAWCVGTASSPRTTSSTPTAAGRRSRTLSVKTRSHWRMTRRMVRGCSVICMFCFAIV